MMLLHGRVNLLVDAIACETIIIRKIDQYWFSQERYQQILRKMAGFYEFLQHLKTPLLLLQMSWVSFHRIDFA